MSSNAEISYIICECGVDFVNTVDLEEHIRNKHTAKSPSTDVGEDGDDDLYILELQKDDYEDDRNVNSDVLLQVTNVNSDVLMQVTEESEFVPGVQHSHVQECTERKLLPNESREVQCGEITLEPPDLQLLQLSGIKLEQPALRLELDDKSVSEQTIDDIQLEECSTISAVPNLKLKTFSNVFLNNHFQDIPIIKFDDDLTNEIILEDSLTNAHGVIKLEIMETANKQSTSEQKSFDQLRFCELCQKVYLGEKVFWAHYRKVHGRSLQKDTNVNQASVCNLCGKVCATKASLRSHRYMHSGQKPYKCLVCNKAFAMKLNLQIHERIHTGERPYQCEVCPKAFSNKAAINRHSLVHTGAKPHACPECGKAFSQSNSMKWHVRTVHWHQPWPYKKRKRDLDN